MNDADLIVFGAFLGFIGAMPLYVALHFIWRFFGGCGCDDD
jgi:nitrate/nitrite transporter NarK